MANPEYTATFSARTNGKAMFVDCSFEYTQDDTLKVPVMSIVRKSNGELLTINQTDLILSAIPEGDVMLSRSMSEKEFKIWTENGDVTKLKARGAGGGTREKISPRSTFALNYYKFADREPVVFKISKNLLKELNDRNYLTINTYNTINDQYQGMTESALTSFGLEVEIVINTNEGRKYLQEQIKSAAVQIPNPFPIVLQRKYKIIPPKNLTNEQIKLWNQEQLQMLYEQEKAAGLQ